VLKTLCSPLARLRGRPEFIEGPNGGAVEIIPPFLFELPGDALTEINLLNFQSMILNLRAVARAPVLSPYIFSPI